MPVFSEVAAASSRAGWTGINGGKGTERTEVLIDRQLHYPRQKRKFIEIMRGYRDVPAGGCTLRAGVPGGRVYLAVYLAGECTLRAGVPCGRVEMRVPRPPSSPPGLLLLGATLGPVDTSVEEKRPSLKQEEEEQEEF